MKASAAQGVTVASVGAGGPRAALPSQEGTVFEDLFLLPCLSQVPGAFAQRLSAHCFQAVPRAGRYAGGLSESSKKNK